MAKCDIFSCVSHLWKTDDAEGRLRNQLEVHQARLRLVASEISGLEAAKLAAARSGKMDAAKAAIRSRRKKEAQLLKYQHLRDFCESALMRVSDVATVGETLEALGAVRQKIGDAKLEDLYDKFSGAVADMSAGNETIADIQVRKSDLLYNVQGAASPHFLLSRRGSGQGVARGAGAPLHGS
jgi:hypothetical protein